MYNLKQAVTPHTPRDVLCPQQCKMIEETQQYLQKHKIHELCNQILAKVIEKRPEKVKEQMISILQKIKEKQYYYRKSDFEVIFDGYDIFGTHGNGQISYIFLIQALGNINIHYTQNQFMEKYPQFKLDKGVKKSDFASIMQNEYKRKIEK